MPGLTIPVTARDHAIGPADAPLTLVQYGDFQCPHCALAYPIVREIRQELSDTLRLVFRHFPLKQVHPLAQRAALAAEAAALQGRFWEMLDLMYQNHEQLNDDALVKYAKKAGVDGKRFRQDLEAGAGADRIRADFLGGVRSGVNGTPSFYINGEKHEGSWEFEPLVAALVRAGKVKA